MSRLTTKQRRSRHRGRTRAWVRWFTLGPGGRVLSKGTALVPVLSAFTVVEVPRRFGMSLPAMAEFAYTRGYAKPEARTVPK